MSDVFTQLRQPHPQQLVLKKTKLAGCKRAKSIEECQIALPGPVLHGMAVKGGCYST